MGTSASPLVERIHATLPHTQCTKCGYAGCKPYAQAIADGSADINRCPPGGQAGIDALARLIGRPSTTLDPACGTEGPRRVAFIIESLCIGCTKCIQACPVDAIVGAAKRMHTVVPDVCSGCDLCVAPCPVDCIEMRTELPNGACVPAWTRADADAALARYESREQRLIQEREESDRKKKLDRKRDIIAAAIARARRRSEASS
ncbi:MAG TPA: RnfABCDGE type electron transport complex subunit B [Burkholderiaceae bacterium]|nr:RnfABCDGE type electron transport complex subunit B [Burkholderiaceae bacterium]